MTFAGLLDRREIASLRAWLEANLAPWSTVEQLAVLAVAIGIAMAQRPRLARAIGASAMARSEAAALRLPAIALARVAPWLLAWALVAIGDQAVLALHPHARLLQLASSLILAWIVISTTSLLVRRPSLARAIAGLAWTVAALNIAHLLVPATRLLDAIAITVGTLRISALLVLKGALLLAVLLWLANFVARIIEQRLARARDLSPSLRVLAAKLSRISLLTLAVVVALGAVGIDLTAFAVFSGAIGVGLGFGLQKVVSNLVSGVILLLDRSIKPGDVIEIDGTYGWITRLNARFVSVVTRDGTEYLIPNEDLITQRVTNWSYSNDFVRLHVPFGISYAADPHRAIALAMAALAETPRVLAEPAPICLLTGFGDSSVDLEARFWINDPRVGTANVKSDVLLRLWDAFKEAGIELPFPQRDLHVRNPDALARALRGAVAPSGGADGAAVP